MQGARYVQVLLNEEPPLGDFQEWISSAVEKGKDVNGAYPPVADMWNRLLRKVKAGETIYLPNSRYGDKNRTIVYNFLTEIVFALSNQVDVCLPGVPRHLASTHATRHLASTHDRAIVRVSVDRASMRV